ncbi:MAG TPA: RICIN domain-containing protein [Kofleriaceae bacterium]
MGQASGRCIDVNAASQANGAVVELYDCLGNANQDFAVQPRGDAFQIVARHSGKCLDVDGFSTADGAGVHQWECHGGDNQRWRLQDVGNGTQQLVSVNSGKCLDAGGTGNGTGLQQWTCWGGANQRWQVAGGTQAAVIGAYVDGFSAAGAGGATKEDNLRLLEQYLGVPIGSMRALEYGNNDSWAGFQSGFGWSTGGWYAANPARKMQWSVPMTVWGTSLADVAAGGYDAYFADAARTIAQHYPAAAIRLGWEMNGYWMPWAAQGHEQDFINAFRRIVGIFRGVSGQFTFDWCPNFGVQNVDPELLYPGDDVVDTIGMDYYEQDWGDPVSRWDYSLNSDARGLRWHAAFAARHGKRMSYPEFGSGKGGDSGYFVTQMASWIASNNVAYATYWNSNADYPGRMDQNAYPAIGAAFRAAFDALISQQ